MTEKQRQSDDNLLKMQVDNVGFLLDRLGRDCHPLQFLRELTQNSLEAIQRSGEPGQIIWDVEPAQMILNDVQKLCIIDSGCGMTGDEMVKFINQLSASIGEQSFSENYGVGAKIAAATRNHEGVVYMSWKNGQGSMIHLQRDSDTGQYGLIKHQKKDGTYSSYLLIDDDLKHENIKDHGTIVVLLGNSPDESTMTAPERVPSPSRWVSKYLNTRYFRFPENVTVRAREGWDFPSADKDRNVLRKLMGQEGYLKRHSEKSGTTELTNATAHWWILKDEPAINNNSGYIESAGHIAALYQNELYEIASARRGMRKLQQFGITFGYRFVVIYIEPHKDKLKDKITTNTARTMLLLENENLPWGDWAEEFREKMPEELKAFVQEKAAGSASTDHSKSIRDRLKDIIDLYKISRYRPAPDGTLLIDSDQLVRGGRPSKERESSPSKTPRRSGRKGGSAGSLYSAFEKDSGIPGEKITPDPFPETTWVTIENGTRAQGYLEDRAAGYIEESNLLQINADFRVFKDMIEFFTKEFGDGPGVRDVVHDVVCAWFEQALVETVIGVQALQGTSKEWTQDYYTVAISEEALTSSVMQRYHVITSVRRELANKLGPSKIKRAG